MRRALAIGASAALLLSITAEAHKGITSKFTYTADVYPIFLNRCGRCHIDGGVAPMSLLKYEDAFPWAESLRIELLDAGSGEVDDFVKAAHRDLSARELDIVLDWATGGTPEGNKADTSATATLKNEWAQGEPDLAVPIPSAFQMAAEVMETTQEFVVPVGTKRLPIVTAIDVLPGNPAIVRETAILLRYRNTVKTLGIWTPRQVPAPVVMKPPLRLTPDSELVARIHYKKTWKYEGQSMTDRSTIGLYFQ